MATPTITLSPVHRSALVQVVRPGARYAVTAEGDELRGAWVPDGVRCAAGQRDSFTSPEGMLLLPLLRARHAGGRPRAPATTPHGRLIDRACRRLGISAEQLATRIDAHESILSRARTGNATLLPKHLDALHALLAEAR